MDQSAFWRTWFPFEGLVDLILIFNILLVLFIVQLIFLFFFQISLEMDIIYLNIS